MNDAYYRAKVLDGLKIRKGIAILYWKTVFLNYFRRAIFIPFLDDLLLHLKARFLEYRQLLVKIENIILVRCTSLNSDEMGATAEVLEAGWADDVQGAAQKPNVFLNATVRKMRGWEKRDFGSW